MKPQISKQIQYILEHHPRLRLTDWQQQLFLAGEEQHRGWQNQLARSRRMTRQSITNTLRIAREKVQAADDFLRLARGDFSVFEKYQTGWATAPIRRLLWDALRLHGEQTTVSLRHMLVPMQEELVTTALGILEEESRRWRTSRILNSQRLSQAYNILITAAHCDPRRSDLARRIIHFARDIARHSWIIHRFLRRSLHLFDVHARDVHRQWLEEKIVDDDGEGERFATYAFLYYGGANQEMAQHFLASDGTLTLQCYSYDPVVARLYRNMMITAYDTTLWEDINFLRIALMAQHIPLNPATVSPMSRNALRTLCQKALRSPDSFVVRQAELLLLT